MNKRLVTVALLLASCSLQDRGISARIREQVQASQTAPLDLAHVGPRGWDRACIFGPYSTKEEVEATLGFKWNVDAHSSVAANDGINLIVFVRNKEVLAYVDHRRIDGDFDSDKTPCTTRDQPALPRGTRRDGIPLFKVPKVPAG